MQRSANVADQREQVLAVAGEALKFAQQLKCLTRERTGKPASAESDPVFASMLYPTTLAPVVTYRYEPVPSVPM